MLVLLAVLSSNLYLISLLFICSYVMGIGEAEAFSERLKRELLALEAANVHAILESEPLIEEVFLFSIVYLVLCFFFSYRVLILFTFFKKVFYSLLAPL